MEELKMVSERVTILEAKQTTLEASLGVVKQDQEALKITQNALDRSQAVTNAEFMQIKEGLKEIKGSLTWVTRIILSSLVLAFMAFIVGGGLSSVQ